MAGFVNQRRAKPIVGFLFVDPHIVGAVGRPRKSAQSKPLTSKSILGKVNGRERMIRRNGRLSQTGIAAVPIARLVRICVGYASRTSQQGRGRWRTKADVAGSGVPGGGGSTNGGLVEKPAGSVSNSSRFSETMFRPEMIVEMSNVALPGMNNVPDKIVSLLGPDGRGQ